MFHVSWRYAHGLFAIRVGVRNVFAVTYPPKNQSMCRRQHWSGPPVRNLEQGRNVSMYRTSMQCRPAGRLSGPLVVSMRPIPASQVVTAVQVTARMPDVHGAPVHVGSPSSLGITDLASPDFGDAVDAYDGDVPVFWACGVTPQAALMASKPPFAITHAPGHMFVTDVPDSVYRQP